MSETEVDEMRREFSTLVRVAVQTALRIAEDAARRREQQLRESHKHSEQRGREMRERFIAERAAIEAQLRSVFETSWYDNIDPQRLAQTYAQSQAWAQHSPLAKAAADELRAQVQNRYGFDIAKPAPAATVDKERQAATEAVNEAQRVERDSDEDIAAAGSDESPVVHAEAEFGYDSPERDAALTWELREAGLDDEAVTARVEAGQDQGAPPTEAVSPTTGKQPRARRARGPRSRSIERFHPGR